MPVTLKNKNNTLYAFLKGEIDHHTAPEIRESIDDAILLYETSKLVSTVTLPSVISIL